MRLQLQSQGPIHRHQVRHALSQIVSRRRCQSQNPIVPHAVKLRRCQQSHPQASL